MPERADDLIDRRSLRRKLSFWRIAALALIAAVVAGAAAYFWQGGNAGTAAVSHIARLEIHGTITEDDELLERIERIGASPLVAGVIVHINSPGGTTAGGEAVYEALRKLAVEKPVVAQLGTLAASAGYMVASATDHIVSRQSSIVGSIGVLIQYPDLTGLMENIGVGIDGVRSSPLKAEPSPFTPTTEEERAMLRALVMDSYDWFVDLVEERRPLDRAQVLALADGSIYTGRQALESGLVDSLGGQDEALAWLATRGVDPDLNVVDWEARDNRPLIARVLGGSVAEIVGLDRLAADLLARTGIEPLFLDGLVSVWHPRPSVGTD